MSALPQSVPEAPIRMVLQTAARVLRSPVTLALGAGGLVAGLIIVAGGYDASAALQSFLTGALAPRNLPSTLNLAIPIVGMAISAAIAFRAGCINLGGAGQLVIGALTAAAIPLYLPISGIVGIVVSVFLAMAAAAALALVPAVLEVRLRVPMLISSLLLSYPVAGLAAYAVRYPLGTPGSGLPQSPLLPGDVRLPELLPGVDLNSGLLCVVAVVVLTVFVYERTSLGFELKLHGLNPRFSSYVGAESRRITYAAMAASGAVAGLVGAVIVLGDHHRFLDGALTGPGYTWTGITAAILAAFKPIPTVAAGLFFTVLQTGGLGMERDLALPRYIVQVVQAAIILVMAMRAGVGFAAARRDGP